MSDARQALRTAVRDPCTVFPKKGPKKKRTVSRLTIQLAPEQELIIKEIQTELASEGVMLSKADIVRASISQLNAPEDEPAEPLQSRSETPEADHSEQSPQPHDTNIAALPFKTK